MSEIDLIPTAYRRSLRLRTWTLRLALAVAALVTVLGTTKLGLSQAIRSEQREVDELRLAGRLALERRAKLEQLSAEGAEIRRQLAILEQLREGIAAKQMFVVIDRALDGTVWFSNWKFRRAGEVVELKPEAVHAGHFIVLPRRGKDGPERVWRLRAHMEIHAQALDHSSLARFVRRLVEQPEIDEVRVLNTRVQGNASSALVTFKLAVLVRARS